MKDLWALKMLWRGLYISNISRRANLLCCLGLLYRCFLFLFLFLFLFFYLTYSYVVLREVSHGLLLLLRSYVCCFIEVPTVICCINILHYCILSELSPWTSQIFISVIINVFRLEFYLAWYYDSDLYFYFCLHFPGITLSIVLFNFS